MLSCILCCKGSGKKDDIDFMLEKERSEENKRLVSSFCYLTCG
jgi:hypothetical protein